MSILAQEINAAWKVSRRYPGSALIAALTLGLSFALLFSAVGLTQTILLHPFPFPSLDRLVLLWQVNESFRDSPVLGGVWNEIPTSYPNFLDLRRSSSLLDDLAAVREGTVDITDVEEPERLVSAQVSTNLMALLGATASLGRTFTADDEQPGGVRVAIISHSVWARRFGLRIDIVGKTIRLNDTFRYLIVGVMPNTFRFPSDRTEIWLPLRERSDPRERLDKSLLVVGHLRSGVSVRQVSEEMAAIASRLAREYPSTNRGWGIRVVRLSEHFTRGMRLPVLVLSGTAFLVTMIACANVVAIQLSVLSERRQEFAIRAAVGASPIDLARQLFVESMLASSVPGAAAFAAASPAIVSLGRMWFPQILFDLDRGYDWAAAVISLSAITTVAVAFTTVLYAHARKYSFAPSLKEAAISRGRLRTLQLIVSAQIVVSLLTCTSAGLLLRSFRQLQRVELGFQTDNITAVQVPLPPSRYSQEAVQQFLPELCDRLRRLPYIRNASAISSLPLRSSLSAVIYRAADAPDVSSMGSVAQSAVVLPGYFATMGISFLAGRDFERGDNRQSMPVVIVTEGLAKGIWPDRDPIGRRLLIGRSGGVSATVVGMVSDFRHTLDAPTRPTIFVAHAQTLHRVVRDMHLVIRMHESHPAVAADIRGEIRWLDPQAVITQISFLSDLVTAALARQRLQSWLMIAVASAAYLFSAMGTYGMSSYYANQRGREVAIRIAHGASARDILFLFTWRILRPVAISIAVGAITALAVGRLFTAILFETSARDPFVLISAIVMTGITALIAAVLPVVHVATQPPSQLLRYE